jgi:hypothetical protein
MMIPVFDVLFGSFSHLKTEKLFNTNNKIFSLEPYLFTDSQSMPEDVNFYFIVKLAKVDAYFVGDHTAIGHVC